MAPAPAGAIALSAHCPVFQLALRGAPRPSRRPRRPPGDDSALAGRIALAGHPPTPESRTGPARASATERAGALPGADGGNPLLELLDARLRARRPAADLPQLGVDLPVRPVRPVVLRRDQRVELAPQLRPALERRHLLGRQRRGGVRGGLAPLLRRELLGLVLGQQRSHLLRREQAGQPEVVLLLGRAGAGAGAERGAVVDHLVEVRRRAERGELAVLVSVLVQLAVGGGQCLVVEELLAGRALQHVVALE